MERLTKTKTILLSIIAMCVFTPAFADPIDDFYKDHKKDNEMEARMIPPKAASLMVDEEYVDAKDILMSMYSLKYLNYYGEKPIISNYAKGALKHKGDFEMLFEDSDFYRTVHVYGVRKRNGKVKKVMAVLESQNQFVLVIGKGSLTQEQIEKFPALSKEIQ